MISRIKLPFLALLATAMLTGCGTLPGTGPDRDPVTEMRADAAAGDADSQYRLGLAYHGGVGVEQNYAEAVRWFEASARQGNPDAAFMAGSAYLSARGVAQDAERAEPLLEQAAASGHARAQYLLGDLYLNARGVEQERLWGLRWILDAARQGHGRAMTTLGAAYRGGLFGKAAPANALYWIEQAAAADEALAREALPTVRQEAAATDAAQPADLPLLPRGGGWSPEIAFTQLALKTLGYDAGPVDGLRGPRTTRALDAFLRDAGAEIPANPAGPDVLDALRKAIQPEATA